LDLALADLATGPVDRVWYSADGSTLYALTTSGKTFETSDFETWKASTAVAPLPVEAMAGRSPAPEPGSHLRAAVGQPALLYGFNKFVYRSTDTGANWSNLTAFRTQSLIGDGLRDLAVSPRDGEEIAVAGSAGVFRSLDGGKSWSGMNQGLPNLPAARIRKVPSEDRGVQLELPGAAMVEWQPGEKTAWRPTDSTVAVNDAVLRQALTAPGGARVTSARAAGNIYYVGRADGSISIRSGDVEIPSASNQAGAVERFWVDSADSTVALAVLGSRPQTASSGVQPQHVLHTVSAGSYWEDITFNLPDVAVHGVTASRNGRAIYLATDSGVFYGRTDPGSSGAPVSWQRVAGLPSGTVTDVMLDPSGNQLWAMVEGFGVYETIAPHRLVNPAVASAADLTPRLAAPGSLLSVIGARITSASAGDQSVPVLKATDTQTEIQIPFTAQGDTLALSLNPVSGSRITAPLPLVAAAPAIFVITDGTPWVLDAETGTMIDASHPAHAGSRIQVLATGLGRVNPDWPAGVEAPVANPPSVIAKVTAHLDRIPVPVTRAVLAPQYTGFYLVELELPRIVNYGPVELHLEAGGNTSNRVRVYIEP
jgi:uncharacterized protein (TIGR03437 family)